MPHVPDEFYEIVDIELPEQPKRGREPKAIPKKRPSGTAVDTSSTSSLLPKMSLSGKLSMGQFEFWA